MGTIPKTRTSAVAADPPVKLNSWKEIASYLDRDPRTVQLWEKYEGLPVHRLTHRARASVYAFTNELEAWLRGRSGQSTVHSALPSPASAGISSRTPLLARPYLLAGVAIACAGLLAAGWWAVKAHSAATPLPGGMMVVLPFENQNSSNDLLVEGLTDSLIADLGKSGRIQVISRRSVMRFKGSHLPLPQIAAQLHAAMALEGTVAQVGNEWRVTVELLDAAQERHLWGATYTRRTDEILSREDELASVIAAAVTLNLTGVAPPPAAPGSTAPVNPQATQAYLTGRFYWNQRDLPGLQKAVSYFDQAIAIDAKYAPAYAGLADSYDLLTDRGGLPAHEAFHRAKAAAQTALALDPGSAEAYNALAVATCREDWDFAGAEQDFKKAIQLDANNAVAHQWYGEFLGDLRRFDQSIAELKKARELDPLSPMVGADLADGYLHAGRYAEAEAELRRILDLYPDFVPAHRYLGTVLVVQSKFDQAASEARIYQQQTGDQTLLQSVEIRRLVAAGKLDEARAEVQQLLNGKNGAAFNSYQRAGFYFMTGNTDAAYAALQDAYRERSWWLVTMLVDPGFDGIRNEPRFQDLARRVGLPLDGVAGSGDSVIASR